MKKHTKTLLIYMGMTATISLLLMLCAIMLNGFKESPQQHGYLIMSAILAWLASGVGFPALVKHVLDNQKIFKQWLIDTKAIEKKGVNKK